MQFKIFDCTVKPIAALRLLALFLYSCAPPPAGAADLVGPPQQKLGWAEVWSGADATRDVWVLYSGVTLAPWSDIREDGIRLRAGGGYGQYSYRGSKIAPSPCGSPRFAPCVYVPQEFNVDVSFIDALVGYQKRFGELTAKAFVGVSGISHQFDVRDPNNEVIGAAVGARALIELWLNLGPQAWTSLDLGYTSAHETGSARWRAGWRIIPAVSIGPEVKYDTNAEDDATRAGAFLRYEWSGGEISASGGYAGVITGGDDQDPAPYATLNVLTRF